MSTIINEYKLDGGTYYSLNGGGGENKSWRNITGTPIISVTPNGEGNLIAGIYTITFATGSVTPGTNANALVSCDDPHNPNINQSGITVSLDGSTAANNVIQGLNIVFSDSSSFAENWEAKIYVGSYWKSSTSEEISVTCLHAQDAGVTTDGERLCLKNDGTTVAIDCSVMVVNKARFKNTNQRVFKSLTQRQYNPTADDNNNGASVTLANFQTGTPNTVDLLVGGVGYNMTDLNTGNQHNNGAALKADGVTPYMFNAGTKYQGIVIVLDANIASSGPTATLWISDGAQFIELAPDVSGAAGTWQNGTTKLTLTEDGKTSGEISAGGAAFFWFRFKSGGTATPDRNQRTWTFVYEAKGV